MTQKLPYPLPINEEARLQVLDALKIFDTPPEEDFNLIVGLAAHLFQVPIALVSLVGKDRQCFKATVGLDVCGTGRDVSFCAHAILQDEVMIVEDAQRDPRFASNALVTGNPFIRFYAGAPLVASGGHKVGTLCIIDRVPRPALSDHDQITLKRLARMVIIRMHLRSLLNKQKNLIGNLFGADAVKEPA